MGKRGFTLLELMIVIIIIGVLATVAIVQYQSTIEKSRAAEARSVIGTLRSACAALWMENSNTSDCNATNLRLGSGTGLIPSGSCGSAYWFRYTFTSNDANNITFTASRCTASGKNPNYSSATSPTIALICNFTSGLDLWSSQSPY